MMNYRVLGWISLTLAVIAAAPFWLRTLNQRTVKTRDKRFLSLIKRLRPAHKAAGLLLAFISLTHGWLALGGRLSEVVRLAPGFDMAQQHRLNVRKGEVCGQPV